MVYRIGKPVEGKHGQKKVLLCILAIVKSWFTIKMKDAVRGFFQFPKI